MPSAEEEKLFQEFLNPYIEKIEEFKPDFKTELKCFLPSFLPVIGTPDDFVRPPRPDGVDDELGLKVLNEEILLGRLPIDLDELLNEKKNNDLVPKAEKEEKKEEVKEKEKEKETKTEEVNEEIQLPPIREFYVNYISEEDEEEDLYSFKENENTPIRQDIIPPGTKFLLLETKVKTDSSNNCFIHVKVFQTTEKSLKNKTGWIDITSTDAVQYYNKIQNILILPEKDLTEEEKIKEQELQQALQKGSKAWNRSKIMILGEGRAGKTALANSIMGRSFYETESTIGISQFTCDVKYARLGNGQWDSYEKPEKELEVALAKMIYDHRLKRDKSKSKNLEGKKLYSAEYPSFAEEQAEKNQAALEMEELANVSNLVKRERSKRMQSEVKASSQQDEPKAQPKEDKKVSPATKPTEEEPKAQAKVEAPQAASKTIDSKPSVAPTENKTKSGEIPVPKAKETKAPPPKKLQAAEIDNELITKCLTNQLNIDSKFIISLYDFGGQSVFNVIHPFFLTRYGVYAVVFNMEWLVNGPENPYYEQCLSYMNFWINSIVIHTFNAKTNETAPVLFIGTRKDNISKPKDHQKISLVIYEKFKNHICWPFVLENSHGISENGRCNLWFFPIDNTKGRNDPMLTYLMQLFEETIDGSDYVHQEKPLVWLKTVDELRSLSKSFISYEETTAIATKCGVSTVLIPELLTFLHEMGYLMWHNEEELRDIIILDPISYFVTPSTILICKHQPTENDTTHHLLDVHKQCRKKFYEDWQIMLEYGTVSARLLKGLLQSYEITHQKKVITLMIKYGLIVPISFQSEEEISSSLQSSSSYSHIDLTDITTLYLVPALLPVISNYFDDDGNNDDENDAENSNTEKNITYQQSNIHRKYMNILSTFKPNLSATFYFVFTTSHMFEKMSIMTWRDIADYGFLPSGFFERLICKAVSWCQETSCNTSSSSSSVGDWNYEDYLLCQNQAILSFGNQRFRLINHISYSMIQVEIEGMNPLAIHERLLNQIKKIIEECMKYLKVFTVIPYTTNQVAIFEEIEQNPSRFKSFRKNLFPPDLQQQKKPSNKPDEILLIKLNKVLQTAVQHTELTIHAHGSRALLSQREIFIIFKAWLDDLTMKSSYDLFISYRWGHYDSNFVQGIYDTFTLYNITKQHRSIVVFVDKYRLQEGRDYSDDFMNALFSSKIIIPIISMDCCKKFLDHNPSLVDNVLLEWLLTLECYQQYHEQEKKKNLNTAASSASSSNSSQVKRILPIFIGSHQVSVETNKKVISNFFSETSTLLKSLPNDLIPTATIQKACGLFEKKQIIPSQEFQTMTIKRLVEKFVGFLGISLWELQYAPISMMKKTIEKILGPLRDLIQEEERQQEEEKERLLLLKLQQEKEEKERAAAAAAAAAVTTPSSPVRPAASSSSAAAKPLTSSSSTGQLKILLSSPPTAEELLICDQAIQTKFINYEDYLQQLSQLQTIHEFIMKSLSLKLSMAEKNMNQVKQLTTEIKEWKNQHSSFLNLKCEYSSGQDYLSQIEHIQESLGKMIHYLELCSEENFDYFDVTEYERCSNLAQSMEGMANEIRNAFIH